MESSAEVEPGTVGLVFAVPILGVAVLLSVPTSAVTDVAVVPHSFGLGFVFGDLVISAFLRGITCT